MRRTNGLSSSRIRLFLGASLAALCVAAGCGGGGGSSPSSGSGAATAQSTLAPLGIELVPASEAGTNPIVQPSAGQLSPTTLSQSFTAVGQQIGLLVYEPGFTGTFSANAQNCSPASPVPVVVTPPNITGVKSEVFVVTAASAGFCDVKITDGVQGAALLVDVTTTTGTISSVGRH